MCCLPKQSKLALTLAALCTYIGKADNLAQMTVLIQKQSVRYTWL
jgi:hypothetical protein